MALVVGAIGIASSAVAEDLLDVGGWDVLALSRNPGAAAEGITSVAADLTDPDATASALAEVHPTHVFFTSWLRRPTEQENCEVNGAMVRNLFAALEGAGFVRHAALLTGLKHYLVSR